MRVTTDLWSLKPFCTQKDTFCNQCVYADGIFWLKDFGQSLCRIRLRVRGRSQMLNINLCENHEDLREGHLPGDLSWIGLDLGWSTTSKKFSSAHAELDVVFNNQATGTKVNQTNVHGKISLYPFYYFKASVKYVLKLTMTQAILKSLIARENFIYMIENTHIYAFLYGN